MEKPGGNPCFGGKSIGKYENLIGHVVSELDKARQDFGCPVSVLNPQSYVPSTSDCSRSIISLCIFTVYT